MPAAGSPCGTGPIAESAASWAMASDAKAGLYLWPLLPPQLPLSGNVHLRSIAGGPALSRMSVMGGGPSGGRIAADHGSRTSAARPSGSGTVEKCPG